MFAQPVTMACNRSDAECRVAPNWILPAATLVGATNVGAPSLPPHLTPPLVDGWQSRCQTRSDNGPASERATPFDARRSSCDDYSATARKQFQLCFKKSCRQLDEKGMSLWQQQERSLKGSLSARTFEENQESASRQAKLYHSVDRTRGFQKQLRQLDSKMSSTSESVTTSFPISSATSVSSIASTLPDRMPERHDRSNSPENQGSPCKVVLEKKHKAAPQRFDLSIDDWAGVEEEFCPESPVIAVENCN